MADGSLDGSDAQPDLSDHPSVGAALTSAREAAGLSVEQVSAETRIRATVVRDLEADRFASSGATVYARGHLRAIAIAVGTDPGPIVARFDTEQAAAEQQHLARRDTSPRETARRDSARAGVGQRQAPAARVEPDQQPAVLPISDFGGSTFVPPLGAAARERRGPRWGLAVAAAAAVLVVVTVIGLANPAPRTALTVAGPTTGPSPRPSKPAVHTPAPGAVAAKPAPTGAQLRVRLIGGASWVSISNGTKTLFEGVLTDGQFKDFTDPQRLKVILGNAGAVDLNCGGRDGGQAGGSGKVLRFSCTKDGLAPA